MNKLDYLILSELLKDASLSFIEVAKKTGTTHHTVRRRYEKLKKEDLIHKIVISIDLSKLGYQGKALLLISVVPNANKAETIAYLKKVRNIILITEIIGQYDILAIAPIADLNSVQELLKEVKKAPFLLQTKIAFIDNTYFPVDPNFGTILAQKTQKLANTQKGV
jgi:Lrp/AsnC family transcriptional regulator, regulator for asnA, asnC and gidA